MATARNWTATLWPASYMGVPFFFEKDETEGGRSLKVHEFPNADDPYVEDLGRRTRYFSGTAYVTGDDADSQARNLEAICETKGPGTLVIPIEGPLSAHCETFKRTADKDKFGYIAFTVKFVRAGNPGALISTLLLGQQIFDQADVMARALTNVVSTALVLSNQADYVIAAPIDAVQGIVASIETVRVSNPVDPDTSAEVAAADAAIDNAAPLLIALGDPADPGDIANLLADTPAIDPSIADPVQVLIATLVATVRLLGDGMAGNTDAGAGALLSLALDYPAPVISSTLSPNQAAAAANNAAIVNIFRVASLTAWCEALERQTYASRPDGVAARAAAAERLGQQLGNWTGAAGYPVFTALQDLQGAAVQFLTQLITDLAPVVTVSAPQSKPSLWWAWRLYSDPTRAIDLSLRNQVRHPSFMPLSFQALAPGFAAPASLPTAWPAP